MPRYVDAHARRAEIAATAMSIIAKSGVGALTLRTLAEAMNGSITLVTHFVSNRADLFEVIIDELVAGYDTELAELERGTDDYGRLRRFLEWLLPLTDRDIDREAGRIALNAMREEPSVDHFFVTVDARIRELMAVHLAPFLPEDEIPPAVDYLRATMNGVTLSAVEHRDHWSARRQLAVLDMALRTLKLVPASVPS